MPQVVCTPNQPRNFTVIFFYVFARDRNGCTRSFGWSMCVQLAMCHTGANEMHTVLFLFNMVVSKIIAFHVRVMALQAAHMFFPVLVHYVRRTASIDSIVGDLMVCLVFVCPIHRPMHLRFMNLLFAGRVTADDASR